MTYPEPARTAVHRARSRFLAALLVVGAGMTGALAYQSLSAGASSPAPSPAARAPAAEASSVASSSSAASPRDIRQGPLGAADGLLPAGVTAFDTAYPGVARLDPALLRALRDATTDAAAEGVQIVVDSGWRSPAYQERLLVQAISTYGSEKEAARWVATPETSAHVAGEAVDLAPSDATSWLSRRGARYGLCQIYRNEPWHFELRPEAVHAGCPPMYADPTQDPRMWQ